MQISDWSSDVCSSDLICRRKSLWRPRSFYLRLTALPGPGPTGRQPQENFRPQPQMVARITTVAFAKVEGLDIDVQVQTAAGLPTFTVVGLPAKAVADRRHGERQRSERRWDWKVGVSSVRYWWEPEN